MYGYAVDLVRQMVTTRRSEPTRRWFRGISESGFHRVSYLDWGDPGNLEVVVCVHGLTRNARDFDVLARRLSKRYRVICPDIAGRGESSWLGDPNSYSYAQYMADMTALLARLEVEQVDWIGTSMGGLIGLLLAAWDETPIRRLVLNDVGPFLPRSALGRIAGYVGRAPGFTTLNEAEAYLRTIHAQTGQLSDTQWREFTLQSVNAVAEGGYALKYDPSISVGIRAGALTDVDVWSYWEQVKVPVLVLRGAESDMLLPETAAQMAKRGPGADVVEIPNCGHPPSLRVPEQVAVVETWLRQPKGAAVRTGLADTGAATTRR
jgi:pimeloyl-ACP methyl ester carboxylesterase